MVRAAAVRPGGRTTRKGGTADRDRPRPRRARPAAVPDDLLPAARAARDGLRRDGRPLTRDALAARLRAAGHPVGNDRPTPLLAQLRDNPAPAT